MYCVRYAAMRGGSIRWFLQCLLTTSLAVRTYNRPQNGLMPREQSLGINVLYNPFDIPPSI